MMNVQASKQNSAARRTSLSLNGGERKKSPKSKENDSSENDKTKESKCIPALVNEKTPISASEVTQTKEKTNKTSYKDKHQLEAIAIKVNDDVIMVSKITEEEMEDKDITKSDPNINKQVKDELVLELSSKQKDNRESPRKKNNENQEKFTEKIKHSCDDIKYPGKKKNFRVEEVTIKKLIKEDDKKRKSIKKNNGKDENQEAIPNKLQTSAKLDQEIKISDRVSAFNIQSNGLNALIEDNLKCDQIALEVKNQDNIMTKQCTSSSLYEFKEEKLPQITDNSNNDIEMTFLEATKNPKEIENQKQQIDKLVYCNMAEKGISEEKNEPDFKYQYDKSQIHSTPIESVTKNPKIPYLSLRSISGRRSLRPNSDFSFQNSKRGSYTKISLDSDTSYSSVNATVGSEKPNESTFSSLGRGKKREHRTRELANEVDTNIMSPKRLRMSFTGLLSIVSSPVTILGARFSKATIKCSTPNMETKESGENGVENLSVTAVEEIIDIEDDSSEFKKISGMEGNDTHTILESENAPLKKAVVERVTPDIKTKKMCNIM